MYCSLPGSSVHGISQARTLEWVAISSDSYASDFLAVDFAKYALVSIDMVTGMEQQYAECMRIMKLSDEDLEQYRREKLDKEPKTMEKEILQRESRKEEVMQLQKEINEARPKTK